jgi:hypothetical protein
MLSRPLIAIIDHIHKPNPDLSNLIPEITYARPFISEMLKFFVPTKR